MNEKTHSRKERIKTILIIFLVILLLLTFFSNSILNRSLPMVSAEYAGYGVISESVRGSGMITTNQSFDLIAAHTRVIETVSVKNGQEIRQGQTLFVLSASEDPQALELAQDTLREMELAYQKALLSAAPSYAAQNQEIANARADLQTAIDRRNAAMQQQGSITKLEYDIARKTVTESTNQIAALQGFLAALDAGNFAILPTGEQSSIRAYADALALAVAATAEAQAAVDAAQAAMPADPALLEEQLDALQRAADAAEVAYTRAKEDYEASADDTTLRRAMEDAQMAWEYALGDVQDAEAELAALAEQQTALEQAQTFLKGKQQAQAAAQKTYDDYLADCRASYNSQISEHNAAMQKASGVVTAYESQQGTAPDLQALNDAVTMQERQLQSLLLALTETMENDRIAAEIAGLDLQEQQRAIEEQKTLVAEMEATSEPITITSPHRGVISSVNYAAGDTVMEGDCLAQMQLTESGFTVQFLTSAKKAAMVEVGDKAQVEGYYSGDLKATLESIRTDPDNPASGDKLLTFTIDGYGVESGAMVTLSIPGPSQNYDCVVASASVMEDSGGKFVYIVRAKSTPLGNRYYAQRVNVRVLASDGLHTAVEGELSPSDFVISTSEKPLTNGMQIRMEE